MPVVAVALRKRELLALEALVVLVVPEELEGLVEPAVLVAHAPLAGTSELVRLLDYHLGLGEEAGVLRFQKYFEA